MNPPERSAGTSGPGKGSLVLVATPIGNLGDLSPRAVAALAGADVIACEDTRHTRKLLTHAGVPARTLITVADHNEAAAIDKVLGLLRDGKRVALVSDAGTPGISDPGERVVRAAAAEEFAIELIPGPSAVVSALVLSGLPTGRFCFEGFLPRKGRERRDRLAVIAAERRTTVIYEAPGRVAATLRDLADGCGPVREVAVARELTKLHEEVFRGTLAAAADRVEAAGPRGEYVLVVAGAAEPDAGETDDDALAAALTAAMAAGTDRRTAVADVAAAYGVPRRRVYDLAIRLKSPAP